MIRKKVPEGIKTKKIAQKYEDDLKHKYLCGEIGILRSDHDLNALVREWEKVPETGDYSSQAALAWDLGISRLLNFTNYLFFFMDTNSLYSHNR